MEIKECIENLQNIESRIIKKWEPFIYRIRRYVFDESKGLLIEANPSEIVRSTFLKYKNLKHDLFARLNLFDFKIDENVINLIFYVYELHDGKENQKILAKIIFER